VVALLAGPVVGAVAGAVLAAALAADGVRRSESMVLADVGAHPADPVRHARFANLVDGLCSASGVPQPRLYVVNHPAGNSMACARSPRRGSLVVTTGLLDGLSRIELEGVLAHELSHLKSGDALLSTVLAATAGRLPMACDRAFRSRRPAPVPAPVPVPAEAALVGGGPGRSASAGAGAGPATDAGAPGLRSLVGWALAGPAVVSALILRRALDPARETRADAAAASLTRYPPGLVAALEKIASAPDALPHRHGTAHLWLQSPLVRPAPGERQAWLDRALGAPDALPRRVEALREL
jgi:heat shock protein HtpX